MSNFTEGQHITRQVGADLSAKQYYLVKTNAARQALLAAAATDFILGIVAVAPLTSAALNPNTYLNDSVDIATRNGPGTFKVVAGAAIAFGALLTSNASGQAVTATQAGAGVVPTTQVFGYALEAATASGQVIEFAWFDALI